MKIKKVILLFAAVLMCFSFSACSGKNDLVINLTQISDEYIAEEDFPYFLDCAAEVAKAPNGYYYFEGNVLMFVDSAAKTAVPVCSSANCTHSDDDCSAYFGMNYSKIMLAYYNGSLFTHYWTTKSNVRSHYVQQISLDGRERTTRCLLFKTSGGASFRFSVHRGYVYYVRNTLTQDNMSTEAIYKVALNAADEDEQQVVFSYTAEMQLDPCVSQLTFYANHLYFNFSIFTDSELAEYDLYLYDYDIAGDSLTEIDAPNYRYSFTAYKGDIFYYDYKNKAYFKYNTQTQKRVAIENGINDIGILSCDGNYLYIDTLQSVNLEITDERKIYIIDITDDEFKPADTIVLASDENGEYDACIFGAGDFLLFTHLYETDSGSWYIYYYYDKAQIGTGKCAVDDFERL